MQLLEKALWAENEIKAIYAVTKLVDKKNPDQAILINIAQNAKSDKVRLIAAARLADSSLSREMLTVISRTANESWVRKEAIDIINEREIDSISIPGGASWAFQASGESKYYSQKANSLYAASEILKSLNSIPPQTYFSVETQDGVLGRDINGFFTEAPIKTKNLRIDNPCVETDSVQPQSLLGFGDMIKNQTSVAYLKIGGKYAKLILMMKCGKCCYESPIETDAGDMERQCYYCGTMNKTHRAGISVYTEKGPVEV